MNHDDRTPYEWTKPRPFAEHAVLVRQFARLVAELTPDAWQRLIAHCRPLAGSTPEALWRRATVRATAAELTMGLPGPVPPFVHGIRTVYRGFTKGLWLFYEMSDSAFPGDRKPRGPRAEPMTKPEYELVIDANYEVKTALYQNARHSPGVYTAMEAALSAILHHDHLSPSTFAKVYQWVEPEIPFAQVDPR